MIIDLSHSMEMLQHHLARAAVHERAGNVLYAIGSYAKARKWEAKISAEIERRQGLPYLIEATVGYIISKAVEDAIFYGSTTSNPQGIVSLFEKDQK